jgi:hypothetical protein
VASGSWADQVEAVPTLTARLDEPRSVEAVLRLLREATNLAPTTAAAHALLEVVGTECALRLFAVAWLQVQEAEDWQRADHLADTVRAAVGSGAVEADRWAALSGDRDPAVAAGARSIASWIAA